MLTKKETGLAAGGGVRDPFALLRQMASEMDRMFEESAWPRFRWPLLRAKPAVQEATWFPHIDVFVKDNRLFTKIDLPGMKKEDVKVEVTDGQLAVSGERRSESEEKKEHFYRSEREYGSFYRAVPLPDGVKIEDVKATFMDGVLEVSVPLPAQPEPKVRKVTIEDAPATARTAA